MTLFSFNEKQNKKLFSTKRKKNIYIPPFMVGTFSDLEGFELFADA